MPLLESAALFVNETEWRFPGATFLCPRWIAGNFCWKLWARSTDSKVTKGEKHE